MCYEYELMREFAKERWFVVTRRTAKPAQRKAREAAAPAWGRQPTLGGAFD